MNPHETIATHRSLLDRLKHASDQEGWQIFFDRYWKFIYNAAIRAGLSDAEAQEVVQETVLSVARNIEGFHYDPAVCSFKTWMMGVVRWRILGQLKRRQHDRSLSATASAPGQVSDEGDRNFDAIWEAEWQRHLYETALEEIKQRVSPLLIQIFDLYVNEGWQPRRVARSLGVTTARVYLTKHRIGRLLKKEIEKLEKSWS